MVHQVGHLLKSRTRMHGQQNVKFKILRFTKVVKMGTDRQLQPKSQ